jgi:hypothetical protein
MGDGRTIFTLEHQALDTTKLGILKAHHEDRRGRFKSFYFLNHHDSVQYTVRFMDDKLNIEHINSRFANVTVKLIEAN